MNPKILLVDDEEDILDIIETVLKCEGFSRILKANNGKNALHICKEKNPDIIVLDIKLPDIDGYEICRRIREFSTVPIIFVSAKKDEVDKLLSFALGGDDYITKPFSAKELAYRIKAIIRREQIYSKVEINDSINVNDLEIVAEECVVRKNGKHIQLTAKEFSLLLYFVENRNIVLSKSRIIDSVWGSEYDGYDNTLMVHIRKLREKIEDDAANPQYIKTVKKLGYKFIG